MWVVKRFVRTRGINNTPGMVVHPLVHKHPDTEQKVKLTTVFLFLLFFVFAYTISMDNTHN